MFGTKCPKCGSKRIKKVTEGMGAKLRRFALHMFLFITILFVKGPKPLMVCQECGFSWEKR